MREKTFCEFCLYDVTYTVKSKEEIKKLEEKKLNTKRKKRSVKNVEKWFM